MKKIVLPVLAFLTVMPCPAQKFRVTRVEQVKTPAQAELYHPVFSPDGSSLMVSSENYDGLGVIDLSSRRYKRLSSQPGAAYKAVISADGSTVVARSVDEESQRMSLYAIDLVSATPKMLARDIEHINNVSLSGSSLAYACGGRLKTEGISTRKPLGFAPVEAPAVFVTEEDLKMVVYSGGSRRVVDPLMSISGRDLNYCWTSLSPDGKKLLFVAGNDAYVSNIDGSGLVNLGPLHAPCWRGDNWVVAMRDSDDGHVFTASEIVIVGADGGNLQQLSETSGEIKMFPSVSPDGAKVAYHTTEGKVYIMTITQN